ARIARVAAEAAVWRAGIGAAGRAGIGAPTVPAVGAGAAGRARGGGAGVRRAALRLVSLGRHADDRTQDPFRVRAAGLVVGDGVLPVEVEGDGVLRARAHLEPAFQLLARLG